MACNVDGGETEIDVVLIGENSRKCLKDVKAIPWELQYRLVMADIDERRLREVIKSKQNVKRRV